MDELKTIDKIKMLLQTAIDLNCKTLTIDIKFCKELLAALNNIDYKRGEFMDLETWIIRLLDEIQGAANRNENYDLHLESSAVAEIAKAYEKTEWIEIY